jgi:hypothetical protein
MWREIDALRHQTVSQLRVKYLEVFRQESRSNNQKFLVRRLAWRLQANAAAMTPVNRKYVAFVMSDITLRLTIPEAPYAVKWQSNAKLNFILYRQ